MGDETGTSPVNSNDLRKEAAGLMEVKAGDVVQRIWGDGFMVTEMRVEKVDETFVYCDAQREIGVASWNPLAEGSERWKFDLEYGVETDEEQNWGVVPYASGNIVLSRIRVVE